MSTHQYLNKRRRFFLVLSLGVVISCTVILYKRRQLEAAFNQQIEQSDDLWNINYYKKHYFTLLRHHTIIGLAHGLTCLLDIVPTYFLLKFALTTTLYLVLLIDCILLPRYQSGLALHYLHPYFKLQDYFAAAQHLFIGQLFFAVLMMLLMLHSRALYYQLIEQWMAGKNSIVFKNRYSMSSISYNWKHDKEEEEEEEIEEEPKPESKKTESESKKIEPESKKAELENKKTEPENKKTDETKEENKVVKEVLVKPEQKEKKPGIKANVAVAAVKVAS